MLTKKIADFSADLLDTVRGVLGEAKKCEDCGCAKCECEDEEDDMEEGYVPTADEPSDNDKKTAQKIRDMMAKEKKPVKEEAEQIDELSKGTLGRYINKAAGEVGSEAITAGLKIKTGENASKNLNKTLKRQGGIKKAVSKLTKEEAEQIDELSKGTLGKYINKAKDHIDAASWRTGYRQGSKPSKSATDPVIAAKEKQLSKRHKGISTAVSKLTKEEQDFVDALNADTLDEARGRPKKNAGKDFTIHPKTKEKLYHSNPEHMARIEKLQKTGALAKPKTEAGQHIINQLRKASTSMTGGATVHFTHGDSKHVSAAHAGKALDKYAGMKPNEKEDFQKKISHSHENLMKHI